MIEMRWRLMLRTMAVLIVIAAIVDPAFTRAERDRALISVVAASARDSAAATRVAQRLADAFDVVRAPFNAAAATVVVGARTVMADVASPGPVFAVVESIEAPWLSVATDDPPIAMSLDATSRIPVRVGVRRGAPTTISLSLLEHGLVREQQDIAVGPDVDWVDTAVHYVPAAAGLIPVRIVAARHDGTATAQHDLVIDVMEHRTAVLFFDRRPSYQSTFVRRAVEADPRFVVTHRVITGRDASRGVGAPPPSLADDAALEAFDVIVVGAPDALTAADQRTLERFLRRRGGSVVLVQDSVAANPAVQALTGVDRWRDVRGSYIAGSLTDSAMLTRVTRLAVPADPPRDQRPLSYAMIIGDPSPRPTLVLWARFVGAGQLTVSGLLDQWRHRDDPTLDFDRFWSAVIADAAQAVVPPITLLNDAQFVTVNTPVPVRFSLREDLRTSALPVVLHVDSTGRTLDTLAVLRGRGPGDYIALWRTPTAGFARLRIAAGSADRLVTFAVAETIERDGLIDAAGRDAWTHMSGGGTVLLDALDGLPAAIGSAIDAPVRRTPWYPMRSPWWIVALTALLGTEWWLRRRALLP
jgi:hypothetical protein